MYTKKQLSILITIGVVIFLLGIALGFFYEKQLAFKKIKVESVNSLTSKLISSITAYGNVTKIEGRKITLSYLGDSFVVTVANSANIYSLVSPVKEDKTTNVTPVQSMVKFGDIKIGDNINVVLKLLSDGQLEGSSVIIFSSL